MGPFQGARRVPKGRECHKTSLAARKLMSGKQLWGSHALHCAVGGMYGPPVVRLRGGRTLCDNAGMSGLFPDYLTIPAARLSEGDSVSLRVVPDMQALAHAMARDMADVIRTASQAGRRPTLIIPVGPVDQFPLLAELINRERLSLRETVLINMDEYLDERDRWLPADHPLSFRGFMDRNFYNLLDPQLAPPASARVFPDPAYPDAIEILIAERGGVDACFGGIGINGHIAFNEPPEPGELFSPQQFAALPTRVLCLSRETRTINANTVGGSLDVIPHRCITVGMREILGARTLRFYCNRPWQSGVIRRVLFGPVDASCPASFLRQHPDAALTITEQVAAPPDIRLR
jgi:glucosamine-6-phosphate deaminase